MGDNITLHAVRVWKRTQQHPVATINSLMQHPLPYVATPTAGLTAGLLLLPSTVVPFNTRRALTHAGLGCGLAATSARTAALVYPEMRMLSASVCPWVKA